MEQKLEAEWTSYHMLFFSNLCDLLGCPGNNLRKLFLIKPGRFRYCTTTTLTSRLFPRLVRFQAPLWPLHPPFSSADTEYLPHTHLPKVLTAKNLDFSNKASAFLSVMLPLPSFVPPLQVLTHLVLSKTQARKTVKVKWRFFLRASEIAETSS